MDVSFNTARSPRGLAGKVHGTGEPVLKGVHDVRADLVANPRRDPSPGCRGRYCFRIVGKYDDDDQANEQANERLLKE